MNKILNFTVFSLLLLLFACNQESLETPQIEEDLINIEVEIFSLAEYEAGIENVASTRGGKKKTTIVAFITQAGEIIGTANGPSTNLIIVCTGAPASDPTSNCIGIRSEDSCSAVSQCSTNDEPNPANCYCYEAN